MNSNIYSELEWRGLNYQSTSDELGDRLKAEQFTLYCGFDPTAPSLTAGHLLQILRLRRFQLAGHRPIAVAGGGTGLVGDPSFRADERDLMTRDQIESNVEAIRAQLAGLLDFEAGAASALLVNNADWLTKLNLIEFLRDTGKHFSVNAMISRDAIRGRLENREQGISYTEFTYLLMQSYDFLYLFETQGCRLQISGSDQWGNIVAGVDLIRKRKQETVYGLTTPLITLPDGRAMSKTGGGAVWLDAAMTSPYRFYQYWLNTADESVEGMLKFFTFLGREEIAELSEKSKGNPSGREAQRALGFEICTLVHGEAEARKAQGASEALFGEHIRSLDPDVLSEVLADIPSSNRPRSELSAIDLITLLVEAGLATSKSEARQHVSQGGIYVNNRKVAEGHQLSESDLLGGKFVLVRRGRKAHHLLEFS